MIVIADSSKLETAITIMRPDAAAARLEQISPQLASSILLALPPAKAGVILNEMEPKRAAAVTMILAAAARKDDGT